MKIYKLRMAAVAASRHQPAFRVKHGIAPALSKYEPLLRSAVKSEGFQFSKR